MHYKGDFVGENKHFLLQGFCGICELSNVAKRKYAIDCYSALIQSEPACG
jgi:hypothetical protein